VQRHFSRMVAAVAAPTAPASTASIYEQHTEAAANGHDVVWTFLLLNGGTHLGINQATASHCILPAAAADSASAAPNITPVTPIAIRTCRVFRVVRTT
jgi:hypothetical protein